jgi:DNA polymerase III epsilon subunit-like protein
MTKTEYIVVDLETTGLNPTTGQIVEIALLDQDGRCLLSTRYDINIGLQTEKEIDDALAYNKLTRDALALYPVLRAGNIQLIERLLFSADYVIGHNVAFDRSFLEQASLRLLGHDCFEGITWKCSMEKLAKEKGIKSGRIKLPNMQLGAIAHSALSDAENCRLLWESLREDKSKSWGHF